MTNEEAKAIIDKSLENGGWIPEADSFSFAELVRDALEKQIEAEKKPKRRIDTMTDNELGDLISDLFKAKINGTCSVCPIRQFCELYDCCDNLAHYLLSPAEEKK